MQRILFILIILLSVGTIHAQSDLAIGSAAFSDKYRNNPKATMTIVTSDALKAIMLDTYKGLTLTDSPDEATTLERAVLTDGKTATDREVSYKEGHLYYGFYTLRKRGLNNRYIFYLNQHLVGGNKIIVIYMSGEATSREIKKLILNSNK